MNKRFNPDRVKALREAHGLSKAAFGRKIGGVSRACVLNWEKGTVPELPSLAAMAETFEVSLDYFFSQITTTVVIK